MYTTPQVPVAVAVVSVRRGCIGSDVKRALTVDATKELLSFHREYYLELKYHPIHVRCRTPVSS
jgi:hypothetical protein